MSGMRLAATIFKDISLKRHSAIESYLGNIEKKKEAPPKKGILSLVKKQAKKNPTPLDPYVVFR